MFFLERLEPTPEAVLYFIFKNDAKDGLFMQNEAVKKKYDEAIKAGDLDAVLRSGAVQGVRCDREQRDHGQARRQTRRHQNTRDVTCAAA